MDVVGCHMKLFFDQLNVVRCHMNDLTGHMAVAGVIWNFFLMELTLPGVG